MNAAIDRNLNRLLRGISTDHVETVRDAWRELRGVDAGAVPAILEKLDSDVWEQPPRGPAASYLGVLLALLHELNPNSFETEVTRLRATSLNGFHRRTVDLLARRVEDAPATHVGDSVPVYVSPDISDRGLVAENVARWSRTPGISLGHVTRIDVVARAPHLDYLGRYNLFFSGIVLTWPSRPVPFWQRWFLRLDAEFTFYHEVGHHACGHIEHGQVAEQEEEANNYARSAIARAHPVMSRVARLPLSLLKPLIAARFEAKESA